MHKPITVDEFDQHLPSYCTIEPVGSFSDGRLVYGKIYIPFTTHLLSRDDVEDARRTIVEKGRKKFLRHLRGAGLS
jgi:hypothetical protein